MKSLSLALRRVASLCGALALLSHVCAQTPIILDPPPGTVDGVNILDDNTAIVQLRAPGKSYVHLRGDFNNFVINNSSLMRKSTDGNLHWMQLNNLDPDVQCRGCGTRSPVPSSSLSCRKTCRPQNGKSGCSPSSDCPQTRSPA